MSSDPVVAIHARGIGKRYRVTTSRDRHNTLRDQLSSVARRAFSAARRPLASRAERGARGDAVWALRDVSFDVAPGETVGIIGSNGAGKSTLLKVISQVTVPTLGRAEVRGRIGSLLEVGAGFHSELSGRENVFLNGAVLGMKRGEIVRKFDEIVDFAGVERYIDTAVKFYSSGMYLRLAFSVAVHLEPDILIVDEVLAVGDHDFQRRCLARMSDLSTDLGRTVLVVSHDMRAIQRLCTRCMLLERGRIEAIGRTEDVVGEYLARGSGFSIADAWIDLTAVRRRGSGEARFVEAHYAQGGDPSGPLVTDGPAEFLLRIDASRPVRVASLAVSLAPPGSGPLLNLEMAALGRELDLVEGRNVVRVGLEQLHLRPGLYEVGFWLGDAVHRAVDHIEAGFRLEIAEHGSSRGPRVELKRDGVVSGRYSVELLEPGVEDGTGAANPRREPA